jgi:hypothetical protein
MDDQFGGGIVLSLARNQVGYVLDRAADRAHCAL